MARQEDSCWRCGTAWATEDEPRTPLRLIRGDGDTRSEDADRWTNEGGSVRSDVTVPLPATAASR